MEEVQYYSSKSVCGDHGWPLLIHLMGVFTMDEAVKE
jgi:hypothetical protein